MVTYVQERNQIYYNAFTNDRQYVDMLLLDGAVIVNMLRPRAVKTFHGYSQQVFLPFLKSQLDIVRIVHIVGDVYIPDSLKFTVRKKRGTGTRRRVQIPNNWQEFLRLDEK